MGAGAQAAIGLSSFFMLAGVALVTIAFGGNGWREYQVDLGPEFFAEQMGQDIYNHEGFFTRQFGFFKKCFPGAAPKSNNRVNNINIFVTYEILKLMYHFFWIYFTYHYKRRLLYKKKSSKIDYPDSRNNLENIGEPITCYQSLSKFCTAK